MDFNQDVPFNEYFIIEMAWDENRFAISYYLLLEDRQCLARYLNMGLID